MAASSCHPIAQSATRRMETAMTQDPHIRRQQDGSLDIDFYRTRAVAERRHAMRDDRALRMACAGGLVMAGALGFAVVLPLSPAADRMVAAFANWMHTR
jgi:hypothetical protein